MIGGFIALRIYAYTRIYPFYPRHDFIWGGKWLFFDTMHLEYRPEILRIAREQGAS